MRVYVRDVGGKIIWYERFKDDYVEAFGTKEGWMVLDNLTASEAYYVVLRAYEHCKLESMRDLAVVLIMNRGAWVEVV